MSYPKVIKTFNLGTNSLPSSLTADSINVYVAASANVKIENISF